MAASPFVDALTVRRTFNAPRQKVFNAWKNPELLKLWLGGQHLHSLKVEVDFQTGGHYRLDVETPEGDVLHLTGVYQEIEEPARLVFTWRFEHWPEAETTLVTVTLADNEGQTELTLVHERFRETPTRELHRAGWEQCFDRLNDLLKNAPSR